MVLPKALGSHRQLLPQDAPKLKYPTENPHVYNTVITRSTLFHNDSYEKQLEGKVLRLIDLGVNVNKKTLSNLSISI